MFRTKVVLAPAVLAMVGWTTLATGSTAGAAPSASKPPLCASSAVEVTATTNRAAYSPGQTVKLKSSAKNVSATACSLWLGLDPGFSPSFTVTNTAGKEVWDRCWDNDQPGACFEILYQKRLDPGRTYHTVAQWDQGSSTKASQPPKRVPPGTYTFSTYYQYIGGAQVKFKISPATAAATARWGEAQPARPLPSGDDRRTSAGFRIVRPSRGVGRRFPDRRGPDDRGRYLGHHGG